MGMILMISLSYLRGSERYDKNLKYSFKSLSYLRGSEQLLTV